jgi:hypothetical protein
MISNLPVSEFTLSAVAVYLLQILKNAKWFPWLKAEAAKANRIASIILAFVGSVWTQWQWTADPTTGTHTLIISGLSWAAVGLALWHWASHFAMQETIYRATSNRSQPPPAAKG